jgi:SAM-dependent methyltransferase
MTTLKKSLKWIVRRLRATDADKAEQSIGGREMPSFYYDEAFRADEHFNAPFYQSPYYPTWLVVVDRLRHYGCRRILDVGCGPGQFAGLVDDWGFESYVGLDFSAVAIGKARERVPRFVYRSGDVRAEATYQGLDFDAIVCMEVLEHIEEDLTILSCFPRGTRCMITVPNFPWRSHVRHFDSADAARERYFAFFEDLSVTRLKGVRNPTSQFFLLDGTRNSHGAQSIR